MTLEPLCSRNLDTMCSLRSLLGALLIKKVEKESFALKGTNYHFRKGASAVTFKKQWGRESKAAEGNAQDFKAHCWATIREGKKKFLSVFVLGFVSEVHF